jgi:hypothetical protein
MRIMSTWSGFATAVGLAVRPPVGGAMARRTGRPYTRSELALSEYLAPRELDGVRAFPVPSLVGAQLAAETEAELPAALEALLGRRLCVADWHVAPGIEGPLRKYGLLHTSIAAPPDERRHEAMWLEITGDLVVLGGQPLGDGSDWWEVRQWDATTRLDTALAGPIEIRISSATYSNHLHTGVGVPFYS